MTVPEVRPLLLIMDGHSSHYNPDFIRIAAKEQILIFVFPPSTTHLTQPLDKGCIGPLKTAWNAVCHECYCKNPGRAVSRYDFSALFNETWRRAMTQKNVTGGFKVTGIYPLNRNALKVQDHRRASHFYKRQVWHIYQCIVLMMRRGEAAAIYHWKMSPHS